MRITSNLFPETLKDQLGALQREQFRLQNQIATGLKFTRSSDDPVAFASAQQTTERQSTWRAYLKTTEEASDLGAYNHTAMTDLQRVLSRANELVTRGSGIYSPDQLTIIGREMEAVLEQVVTIANRQRDGHYLFGGTGDAPPVVVAAAGPPPVYGYNAAATYTNAVTRSEIQPGNSVDTGIVAGRTGDFGGFLSSGTTDVLASLTALRDTLLSGNPVDSAGADSQGLQAGLNLVSEYVGRTAARLSVLDLNRTVLKEQIQGGATRLSEQTAVSYTDAIADLNRVQTSYQAAMQSGASILNLSLMNYLRL